MSNIEQQYLDLVKDILQNGYTKGDRTGTGTKSVFGRTIRHSMKDGFPLLTTKKMAWKTMVTELLWFLRGSTNIKYLVDNGCHIWDGDAYKRYKNTQISSITFYDREKHFKVDGLEFNSGYPNYVHFTKEQFINKIKTDDEFAKMWGELGPIYGNQWRSWADYYNGSGEYTDQIANAIHLLKTDPDSRRILVSAWNVGELDQMVLPPCHYSFQFYTRELDETERVKLMDKHLGVIDKDKLPQDYRFYYTEKQLSEHNIPTRAISLIWSQRSVDVGLGLPFNIASYALLLEIIAKEVNMIPEEVIGNLGDCHIYLNHIDGLKEQLTRTPYDLPKLDKLPDYLCKKDNWECYKPNDIKILNYQSHPAIKLPLSN